MILKEPDSAELQGSTKAGRIGFSTGVFAMLLSVLMWATVSFSGCGGAKPVERKMLIAADIVPLAEICRDVGGDRIEVEVLVPPGSSPHTYELSAGQVRFLSEADMLVINGLGLTPWAEDIFSRVDNPDLVVIEAAGEIPPEELIPAWKWDSCMGEEREGEGNDHEHALYDPHVWLDPVLVLYVVEAVEEGLIRLDPTHADAYRANAASLRRDISDLDEEIRRRTAGFTHKEFIAFHSTWTYFARRYGLQQAGLIEVLPGKEPSAGEFAELVEMARARGVKAVFAEVQFNPRIAEAVAEESGGEVKVWTLDPLGDMQDPRKDDYCDLIRYNLDLMEEALR